MFGLDPAAYEREQADLKSRVSQHAGGAIVNVVGCPYLENRSLLLSELAKSEVALMLSLHEGFGLVGWEAIALGVPLILSRSSGLCELLEDRFAPVLYNPVEIQGQADDGPSETDIKTVSKAIFSVATNLDATVEKALRLRELCRKEYTWANCAGTFFAAIDRAQ